MKDTSNTLYWQENGELAFNETEECSKVDLHVHSEYSGIKPNLYIPTATTEFLGVRECYNNVEKTYNFLKERGMQFCTLTDHDSVLGAILMRQKHPEDCFISAEYKVMLDPFKNQRIEVIPVGIDYAGNRKEPLSDSEVLELHEELKHHAQKGILPMVEFCSKLKIPLVPAHLAWQGLMGDNADEPFTAKQFDEVFNLFKYIEINGDMQYENFIDLKLALKKGKILTAGSDDHGYLRLGSIYTASNYKVDSVYEWLQAFHKGDISIGSAATIPDEIENITLNKFVKHKFNANILQLHQDTIHGVKKYMYKGWNSRKWWSNFLIPFVAAPIFVANYAMPEVTLPVAFGTEFLVGWFITELIPIKDRVRWARKSKKLYTALNQYYADIGSSDLRKKKLSLEKKIFDLGEKMGEVIKDSNELGKEPADLFELKQSKINLEGQLEGVDTDISYMYEEYGAEPLPELNAELRGPRRWIFKVVNRKK